MPKQDFEVRRDSSANNVPVVAYNEGADIQDTLLYGAYKTTETVTTDSYGRVTVSQPIISISGRVTTDDSYRRGRDFSVDITANAGNTTYYPGEVDAYNGVIQLYTNASLSTPAGGNISMTVTYYSRKNIEVNANGQFTYEVNINGGTINANLKGSPLNFYRASSVWQSQSDIPQSPLSVWIAHPSNNRISAGEYFCLTSITIPPTFMAQARRVVVSVYYLSVTSPYELVSQAFEFSPVGNNGQHSHPGTTATMVGDVQRIFPGEGIGPYPFYQHPDAVGSTGQPISSQIQVTIYHDGRTNGWNFPFTYRYPNLTGYKYVGD